MSITREQYTALTERHKIVVKGLNAPKHIKPVELELWLDDMDHLRDSTGAVIRWSNGTPAALTDILEVIEPPLEFTYGDVIGDPRHPALRAVYLPNWTDDTPWMTHEGWEAEEWALERLEDGWVLNPDRQENS